jgi:hypothetical protein
MQIVDINKLADDLVKIVGEFDGDLSPADDKYLKDNFLLRLGKVVISLDPGPEYGGKDLSGIK